MAERACRIKVMVASVTRTKQGVYNPDTQKTETREVQSIKMHVVTGRHGDEKDAEENKRFFASTPSGSVEFGTINADAAAQFDLGAEFYVDFTPAE